MSVWHSRLQMCTGAAGERPFQLILTRLLNLELKFSPQLLLERRELIFALGHLLSVRFLGCVRAQVGNECAYSFEKFLVPVSGV